MHIKNSGKNGGVSSNNGDKTPNKDCFISVFFIKFLRSFNVFVMKKWKVLEFFNDFAAEFFTDKITQIIAGDRGNH